MAEQIQEAVEDAGIQDLVEVDFNAEYVQLSLSGAILFDSGKVEILDDAYPIVDKICAILEGYADNLIEVEGHTDNVPISSSTYEDNDVLSMYRARTVVNYIRAHTSIEASHLKSSGRGEYSPIADNSTAEGRARNRRVEIKIYNSLNSNID
jgi:chemotaxis protein MotB